MKKTNSRNLIVAGIVLYPLFFILFHAALSYFILHMAKNYDLQDTIIYALPVVSDTVGSFAIDKKIGLLLFVGSMLYLIFFAYQLLQKKARRTDEEFGSAKICSPGILKRYVGNRKLSDQKYFVLSDKVKINLDSQNVTQRNNNILIIGGSGAGKTTGFVIPNILEKQGNYIITDPKSGTLKMLQAWADREGFVTKSLNIKDLSQSICYNPLAYVTKPEDIGNIVQMILANEEKKENTSKQDPYWDNMAFDLLESITYYVYYSENETRKNLNRVMEIFDEVKIHREKCEFVQILQHILDMRESKQNNTLKHYLQLLYAANKFFGVMSAGEKTAGTIISVLASHVRAFSYPDVKRVLETDEMNMEELAAGRKTDKGIANILLFLILPDDGRSLFNFLINIFYAQIFIYLYEAADRRPDNRLPIYMHIIMDEFFNITLPQNFLNILSTCRSRNIGVSVIIQAISMLTEKFQETGKEIGLGNFDTTLYLGTNEPAAWKYIAERLGKETIAKDSRSRQFGSHGHDSKSTDNLGRETMMVDEVSRLANNQCLIFYKGEFPVQDKKVRMFENGKVVHPKVKEILKLNKIDRKAVIRLLINLKDNEKEFAKTVRKYLYVFSDQEQQWIKAHLKKDVAGVLDHLKQKIEAA